MWWLACTGPVEVVEDSEADEIVAVIEPTWTAEEAEAELERLLAWPLPHSHRLRDLYLEAVRSGDALCPGEGDSLEDGSIPLEGCTASTGWTYRGLSEYSESDDGERVEYELSIADFYITDSDGNTFSVGGRLEYTGDVADGSFEGESRGSFTWPGREGWLDGGASLALTVSGAPTVFPNELHGAVGSLSGEGDLFFDHLGSESTSPCTDGAVEIRDPSGIWLRLEPDCDGCGQLSAGDLELGEVCVDLRVVSTAISESSP